MNVLVYSGPEVIQTSLSHTISTLRSIVLPHYAVQTLSQEALRSQPWSASCALLVFPELRNSFESPSGSVIKGYVESGGAFLGFGTGAILVPCDQGIKSIASPGITKVSLRFFNKQTGSYIYPTWRVRTDSPRSSVVQTDDGDLVTGIYESGTSEFSGFNSRKNVVILGSYAGNSGERPIAGIHNDVGDGKIVLWAPNLEYPLTEEPALNLLLALTRTDINIIEDQRLALLKRSLLFLLQLPSADLNAFSRPLPLFLTSQPSKAAIVSRIADSLATPSLGEQLNVFEDKNDTFHFHLLAESLNLVQKSRTDTAISNDPSTWQPKHLILCPNGTIPDREQTPLFDLRLYYSLLSAVRTKYIGTETVEPWGFGEALLYGEAVTSTQTMLEKNQRFVSRIPAPFVVLASYQFAGRGRGGNVWISPSGCLLFSILLRVSLTSFPTSKLVFVQYLFSLAVVEACRDENVLGERGNNVRLKWPNDIYAVFGPGERKRQKIGGVLVNTSFSEGKVDIIIGCGLNVSNSPPMASLAQLLLLGNNLSRERIAATIFVKFELMWETFLRERGSFDSFMNLYLERWLHSDQLVTLTTVVPNRLVRITGITPDHGLLRTLPERTGWSSVPEGFVDLQPDGNSFDLMAGLIRSKS